MKLRYRNLLAKTQDIQMPSIQTEPLEDGATYEVDEFLGIMLAAQPHWTIVEDKPVKEPTKAKESTGKTRE